MTAVDAAREPVPVLIGTQHRAAARGIAVRRRTGKAGRPGTLREAIVGAAGSRAGLCQAVP